MTILAAASYSRGFPVHKSRSIQVIAVAGGKGGVGKTQLVLNLGRALADLGRRVVLLDADIALGDLATAMGMQPSQTLEDVIAGRARIGEVLLEGPGGLRLLPAPISAGRAALAGLDLHQQAALVHAFNDLSDQLDSLIIDTAPGLSDATLGLISASQEVIIVITGEPASIANARATIAALSETRGLFRFRVVANMVRNAQEAKAAFAKLNLACEDSLDVALHFLGHIPFDDNLRLAAQEQRLLLDLAPRSRAALAVASLADKVAQLPPPAAPSGNLEFFVENLIHLRF
jgi:flagellar biosynthesis protein FlhG